MPELNDSIERFPASSLLPLVTCHEFKIWKATSSQWQRNEMRLLAPCVDVDASPKLHSLIGTENNSGTVKMEPMGFYRVPKSASLSWNYGVWSSRHFMVRGIFDFVGLAIFANCSHVFDSWYNTMAVIVHVTFIYLWLRYYCTRVMKKVWGWSCTYVVWMKWVFI